jgi:hypothetical protein
MQNIAKLCLVGLQKFVHDINTVFRNQSWLWPVAAEEVGAGAAPKLNPPVAGAVAEPRLRLLVGAGAEKLHRKMVSRK